MELLKQQLPCTDILEVQFIWCLSFTEMDLAETRFVSCTQLKVQHFLPSSSNKEPVLVLMNIQHETKTISLANDFKELRPSVEWKYTCGKSDWNSMPRLLQKLFSVLLLLNFTILVALYESPWGIYNIVYIVLVLTLHYNEQHCINYQHACKCCSLAHAKYLWCLKVLYCTVWLGFPW